MVVRVEPKFPHLSIACSDSFFQNSFLVATYGRYRVQKIRRVQVTKNSHFWYRFEKTDFMYIFDRTSTLVQAASSLITRGVI